MAAGTGPSGHGRKALRRRNSGDALAGPLCWPLRKVLFASSPQNMSPVSSVGAGRAAIASIQSLSPARPPVRPEKPSEETPQNQRDGRTGGFHSRPANTPCFLTISALLARPPEIDKVIQLPLLPDYLIPRSRRIGLQNHSRQRGNIFPRKCLLRLRSGARRAPAVPLPRLPSKSGE